MQNVQVAINSKAITVAPNLQPVIGGRFVAWTIVNSDPAVKQVRIEFDDPSHHYFGGTTPHEITKDINGREFVWGKAPLVTSHTAEGHKYTIFGLDNKGNELIRKDPRIVVSEP